MALEDLAMQHQAASRFGQIFNEIEETATKTSDNSNLAQY